MSRTYPLHIITWTSVLVFGRRVSRCVDSLPSPSSRCKVMNMASEHILAIRQPPIVKRVCPTISRHSALALSAALCIYTALACAIFAHHHFFFRHAYFGTVGDPHIYMWFLSWWPYAIT